MYREGICNPNVLEAKAIYFTEICEGVSRQLQIIQDGIFSLQKRSTNAASQALHLVA